MKYEDILFEVRDRVAHIRINRPDVMNAFRAQTVDELIHAIGEAGWNREIGAIVLGGAGDHAFCTGGDQTGHTDGGYGGRGTIGLAIEQLQTTIRDVPKVVIARVQGYAIGGGNVLVTVCDLAVASERAIFGQVGPKVGSVDPGFGTALLARVVGEKRAREMWFTCRRYTAGQALSMGLINTVVGHEALDNEIDRLCAEIVEKSPTALAIAKQSFNADSESIRAIGALGFQSLALFYDTAESKEGVNAFLEKRRPAFRAPKGAR
ncbi:enoyl-CoA hydratase-related protein [Paraburkholderia nemoris]|uniref:enoyl-CoA hydratase-related protein n=1 Tax=Paraburkholderia nemoris TaxID=2793076 RepID=UPI0038BDCAF1